MIQQRINELYQDYSKALNRLQEALEEDPSKGSIIIDGGIKRFEFSFELAWKLARKILQFRGVEVNSPRSAIKGSFSEKIIEDESAWLVMLEDRNKTSHIYDENQAVVIYEKIKNYHFKSLKSFQESIKKTL